MRSATHFPSALHLFGSIGAHYEKNITTGVATRYYYAGGRRVAMRQGGVVYYLLTDHLGSTALTVSSSGSKVAELRYKAWGETRYTWGTTPTTYRYTGQRQEESLGLYQMGARWYDPALSRWLSADTLVPEPGEPQGLNRHSYVNNNPLRYRDLTGHQGSSVVTTWEWIAVGGGTTGLSLAAPELVVAGSLVVGGVGIGGCAYYGTMWVINGPLGPSYPLPEESIPGTIGATYPLPEGSTLSLTTGQAGTTGEFGALGLEMPSLEIPQLETSAETYGLELPTVLEAGKNTPVGRPWEKRPRHQSEPLPKTLNTQPEPPPPVGPPKGPPEDLAELLVWIMYYGARLAAQADKVLPDVLPFEQ